MKTGYEIITKAVSGKTYVNAWLYVEDVTINVKDFANKHGNFTKRDILKEIEESLKIQKFPPKEEKYLKKALKFSLEQLCENNELTVNEEGIYSKKEEFFDLDISKEELEKQLGEKMTLEDFEKLEETIKKYF